MFLIFEIIKIWPYDKLINRKIEFRHVWKDFNKQHDGQVLGPIEYTVGILQENVRCVEISEETQKVSIDYLLSYEKD